MAFVLSLLYFNKTLNANNEVIYNLNTDFCVLTCSSLSLPPSLLTKPPPNVKHDGACLPCQTAKYLLNTQPYTNTNKSTNVLEFINEGMHSRELLKQHIDIEVNPGSKDTQNVLISQNTLCVKEVQIAVKKFTFLANFQSILISELLKQHGDIKSNYGPKDAINGGQNNPQQMKQHGDVQAQPGNIALHLKTGKEYQYCLSCNKNLYIPSYSNCLTNSSLFPFHTCCLPANINLRLDQLLLAGDIEENPGPGNMVLLLHWS
jgi:hypothetical protein